MTTGLYNRELSKRQFGATYVYLFTIPSHLLPSDLVQLCTTDCYYGPARLSVTIPANMSLPTAESRVTPQC